MSLSKFAWVLVAGSVLCAAAATDARACFSVGPAIERERRPSLGYEQALIIHDAKTGREHFLREVTFHRPDGAFGFIVPTPSRPDVAKLTSPFLELRRAFPFVAEPTPDPGFGGSIGSAGPGLTVLEVKPLGSFTAFVLAADDPKALRDWLTNNGLATTPEGDRWLAHYVAKQFFWVAMRYDGRPEARKLTSETVRISFATPAPYYPYLEPARSAGTHALPDRLLDLWVVSTERVTPVSLHDRELVRPLREGNATGPAPFPAGPAAKALGGLLPAGPVFVQTFQDQKVSRDGFGDILFAPTSALEGVARAEREKRLASLIGVLR